MTMNSDPSSIPLMYERNGQSYDKPHLSGWPFLTLSPAWSWSDAQRSSARRCARHARGRAHRDRSLKGHTITRHRWMNPTQVAIKEFVVFTEYVNNFYPCTRLVVVHVLGCTVGSDFQNAIVVEKSHCCRWCKPLDGSDSVSFWEVNALLSREGEVVLLFCFVLLNHHSLTLLFILQKHFLCTFLSVRVLLLVQHRPKIGIYCHIFFPCSSFFLLPFFTCSSMKRGRTLRPIFSDFKQGWGVCLLTVSFQLSQA